MKTLEDIVWAAMRGILWVAAKAYYVKAYGLESVEVEKSGLIPF